MTDRNRRAKSRLKKELGLFDVYSVAAGATLSSGFFLLPGLAAVAAGGAFPLGYLFAALLLVPGVLSKVELATAMPRAGGVYYFIDRSLGPLIGTVAGFGTWGSLVLKTAFALVGVGAYLELFFPEVPLGPLAAAFAIFFGLVNVLGARATGSFQGILVVALLLLLAWFTGRGLLALDPGKFSGFFAAGGEGLLEATGLVLVSYMGLTKVASISEEVEDPERNIPLGLFLAFGSVLLIYLLGTVVMVGVVGVERLSLGGGDLTPVATVAEALSGPVGAVVMTVAAILAFSSVANAGILSASRYPLAMSRDGLLPPFLERIGRRGTPHNAIYLTVAFIVIAVLLFDPTKIAKLAGAFLLLTFALNCLAVIVMRESRIDSYDPGFRSPFYPWIQVLGIVLSFWMIMQEGLLATLFTAAVIAIGAIWYTHVARHRSGREAAIYHVFERLGRQRDEGLDRELREILKEKGLRAADPFDELVAGATTIDLAAGSAFTAAVRAAAESLAPRLGLESGQLEEGFLRGTAVGMTPVSRGAALPHMRIPGSGQPALALVRSFDRVEMDVEVDHLAAGDASHVRAIFFLVSPEADPGRHLRILAQIAGRVDQDGFMEDWLAAGDPQELKEVLLRDERLFAVHLSPATPAGEMVGLTLEELPMPPGTLVALIRRGGEFVIPRGSVTLQLDDRLTIIGEPAGITLLRSQYEA